jgi:hypothetical protein
MRVSANPFNWLWIPKGAYESPTPIYPKRKTFAIAWLGVQLFLDIDDGSHDLSLFGQMFGMPQEAYDEHEVGPTISPASTRGVDLEQGPFN